MCSVHEAAEINRRCGKDFLTVTPGIRPSGAASRRSKPGRDPGRGPAEGADYLVIGRPVTRAADPRQAVAEILAEMAR